MKLTDREYRILLAECASRVLSNPAISNPYEAKSRARELLEACCIENEADSDPSLKMP